MPLLDYPPGKALPLPSPLRRRELSPDPPYKGGMTGYPSRPLKVFGEGGGLGEGTPFKKGSPPPIPARSSRELA
jgi:hypothetical protein